MPVNPDGHAGLLASVTKVFHQKFSPGLVGTQSRVVCMGILAFIFIVSFLNGLPVTDWSRGFLRNRLQMAPINRISTFAF
jgi:hypothetical protein